MDKLAELASKGEWGDVVILLIVLLFGWLANRAINNVDDKIEANKHEVEKLRTDTELEFKQVVDSLTTLTDNATTFAIQNKQDIGKIEGGISYITGFLEGQAQAQAKAQEEKSSARNRRAEDN